MSAPEKERPCDCGGKGLGLNGFHYEGAHGCLKAHDLTSSDIALAKMLAAWDEWDPPSPDIPDEHADALDDVSHALDIRGLVETDQLSPTGRALVERARKAGVL